MWVNLMQLFLNLGLPEQNAATATQFSIVLLIIVLCMIGNLLTRRVLLRVLERMVHNHSNKIKWYEKLLSNKVLHRLSHLITPLIISLFVKYFPLQQDLLNRIISSYVILVFLFVFDALLAAVEDIYRGYEISKTRPIKGLLQVVKIVIFIIAGIILIASLIGQDPLVLLGGISALTAVFMLVFQNAILGFVAGIQLTANDMVRIGDWIEMPKYDANGTVLEISLCTVKVQNFDNTITTVPANALTADSFRNWRGMQDSGGRRIMRSLYLDMRSVCFCTEEMLDSFRKIVYLRDYIEDKQSEIDAYNRAKGVDLSQPVNGRHLTNLGVFRIYITNYLKSHPKIHQDMTLIVRQLEPQPNGVALQIYAFTNSTEWAEYEKIQADIFDHLLAVTPAFGLRVFQNPSGYDFSHALSQNRKSF